MRYVYSPRIGSLKLRIFPSKPRGLWVEWRGRNYYLIDRSPTDQAGKGRP